MWSELIAFFREYMGNGLLIAWFLISLLYLFAEEKKKHLRILFVYVPVVILLIFFNPFLAGQIYTYMGLDGYYRVLWLIPYTVVTGYAIIHLYGRLKGRGRDLYLCVIAVLIVVSGSYIYASPLFRKAENIYHMPESVVEICDVIQVEGREVRAVFPAELIQYVRQYSAVIFMPYGREMLVTSWSNHDDLYDLMEAEVIDAGALCEEARARECHYIILAKDKKIRGSLEDYDYTPFAEKQGYLIYKDATVTLTF